MTKYQISISKSMIKTLTGFREKSDNRSDKIFYGKKIRELQDKLNK